MKKGDSVSVKVCGEEVECVCALASPNQVSIALTPKEGLCWIKSGMVNALLLLLHADGVYRHLVDGTAVEIIAVEAQADPDET